MKKLLESARRGAAWIASQQGSDGAFCKPEDGVGGYYKVPYALSIAGEHERALRLLSWVERHHLTRDGDFRAPERKAREPFHDSWPVYANAWLVQGAHLAGREEIAQRGAVFLRRFQLPCGGYYALDAAIRYIEPVNTAWGGMAAAATGFPEDAHRAANLLARMVDEQPDPRRFYWRMSALGELETGDGAPHVDAGRTKQIYYNPGIALILLATLGSDSHLRAAQRIVEFSNTCAEDVYRFPPSGKLGCGAAILYSRTRDALAQHAALAVAEYLAETQQPDGRWLLPNEEPYSRLANKDGFEVVLDVTAEFTTFLFRIAELLD